MLVDDWNMNRPTLVQEDAVDVYTAAIERSMTRAKLIKESGVFRLARRTCSLYTVEVKTIGAWGKILCTNAHGDWKFYIPSVFTGSFLIDGCCEDGLILYNISGPGSDALLTITWREKDNKLV